MAGITLPKARLAKIMKANGAERISKDAIETMNQKVVTYINEQTALACKMANHAGRKTIKGIDFI